MTDRAPAPPPPDPRVPPTTGDGLKVLIPTRNPPALIGYYLAVFSLVPCLGAVLGLAALVLGLVGLSRVRRDPAVRGTAHAWVAVILGGICGFGWLIVGIAVFVLPQLAKR